MKFSKKISAIGFAISALGAFAPTASQAAIGDDVYAGGGAISIRFEGSDAGYDSNLELWINGLNVTGSIFPNHATIPGTVFNVPGSFIAGTLLDIQLHVATTSDVWHTGAGTGNSDGLTHGDVVYNYLGDVGRTYVGFEDWSGLAGSDRDFNDHMFSFTNTVSAVPEPESFALMLAGLGVMGTIARRRKHGQLSS